MIEYIVWLLMENVLPILCGAYLLTIVVTVVYGIYRTWKGD